MSGNAMLRFWLGAMMSILWTGLSAGEAIAPADVDGALWQRIIVRLKANGLSTESIQACMNPVQEAARQGLPADPVLTRIEEGAAKGVEEKALQEAAQQRLLTLQSAALLLRQAGYGNRNTLNDKLMKSVTLALESGLSVDTLRGVLARANGVHAERMRSIVEAGETMRLSGMDEAVVGSMMTDFTERNMRRTEIIRASRFAVQQHGAHVEGTRIRNQLWDGNGTGGHGGRGQNTTGTAGPGADDPVRRSGPAGSGTTSGQGQRSPSPGNTPIDAGTGEGGSGDSGATSGQGQRSPSPGNTPVDTGTGGGDGGSLGSRGQEGGAPGNAGPADTTPIRRP